MKKNEVMVVKEFTFDSAHYLPGYNGPCERLHGHTYKLQVGFADMVDWKTGMVVDFSIIKKCINDKIISVLDHRTLNDICYCGFPYMNPTAENMVVWLVKVIGDEFCTLSFIRLYETPTSYAEWRK